MLRRTKPMLLRFFLLAAVFFGLPTLAGAQSTFRDCASCPEMVVIEVEGTTFALSAAPITVAEFSAFAGDTQYVSGGHCLSPVARENRDHKSDERWWRAPGIVQEDDHPVVCVAPEDALAYVAWLSVQSGQAYRLPSEEEFRMVMARTGSVEPRRRRERACSGNVFDQAARRARVRIGSTQYYRCDDGYMTTSPVSAFPSNSFGLRDIEGNVYAYASACADEHVLAMGVMAALPQSCTQRAAFGRSWATGANEEPLLRGPVLGSRGNFVGFRVARAGPNAN